MGSIESFNHSLKMGTCSLSKGTINTHKTGTLHLAVLKRMGLGVKPTWIQILTLLFSGCKFGRRVRWTLRLPVSWFFFFFKVETWNGYVTGLLCGYNETMCRVLRTMTGTQWEWGRIVMLLPDGNHNITRNTIRCIPVLCSSAVTWMEPPGRF